jgi:hypothetical protein
MQSSLKTIIEELDNRLKRLYLERDEAYKRNKEIHKRADQMLAEARVEANQLIGASDRSVITATRKLAKARLVRDFLSVVLKEQEDQP